MNIAMFTNTYLPYVGGVANSVIGFSDAFRAKGHRVLVVAPEFDGQPEFERDVIRVKAVRDFNHTGFSFALPPSPAVRREVKEFRPEIVHSHHPFLLGDSAFRIKAAQNVPLVMTYHTMYEQYAHVVPIDLKHIAEIAVSLATSYANECDHIVAPSASVRDVLRARGVETPMTVIPTGVDIRRFERGDMMRARQTLGIPPGAFVIGHVGRLAPEKNLDYLAREVGRALERIAAAVFLVVGDGSEREPMESALSSHPQNQVRFTGCMEGQSLVDAYHAMDVFVFASKSDTQGMVLAEAMACGVPVVGLDAAGTRDIVKHGENGLLVTSEQDGRFADALIGLQDTDPARLRRFGLQAKATAREWSTERCAERCLRVYDETIAQSRRSRDRAASRFVRVAGSVSRLWGRRIAAGARVLMRS
jgi:glycosyltransferase involved in cell wall biosynthesis